MIKLNPNERLLIESGVNRYKLVGPGLIWLKPWQKGLTTFSVAPQVQTLRFEAIHTLEEIPIDVKIQMLYRVDPNLFDDDLLSVIPGLNAGGWQSTLQWQTETTLRRLLAAYNWQKLRSQIIQRRLERHLTKTVADQLNSVGLNLISVHLIKIELPFKLQQVVVQTERDGIEARGRAFVLKEYRDIFGPNLPQAMPHIMQWELLNMLRNNDQSQLLLATSNLSASPSTLEEGITHPMFQLNLPLTENK